MRDLQKDLETCQRATPGPWGICLGSGENLCTAISTEDGKLICDCLPDYAITEKYAVNDHRPNMKFIAEAREGWLEALKALQLACEHINTHCPGDLEDGKVICRGCDCDDATARCWGEYFLMKAREAN